MFRGLGVPAPKTDEAATRSPPRRSVVRTTPGRLWRTIEAADVVDREVGSLLVVRAVCLGLRRELDLITLHPNLMIRTYIVAPDARKSKAMNELARPIFDALEPPLRTVRGFIPYSRPFSEAEIVRRYGDQLKPGFLKGMANCAPDAMDAFRSA